MPPASRSRDRRQPPASPPGGMKDAATAGWRRFGLLAALAVAAAAAITAAFALLGRRDQRPQAKEPSSAAIETVNRPLPWPGSPFLNTREANYVGSEKCVECHEDQHAGYRHSGMGRSLATVDAQREPPDAALEHGPSGRRYEVIRRNGKMVHRELLLNAAGNHVVINDHPVTYVIGSGNHARGYLIELDGFLVQSPLTWYASRQVWDMSPGYDVPRHMGFSRPVDQGCLVCHAGRSRALDGTFHKMEITEEWIGCERCHGPGSLHVQSHEGSDPRSGSAAADIDRTIVNSRHLSRELADDVCAQCHLRSVASCLVRGRTLADYRPGLPLSAVRTEFRLGDGDDPMSIVGHVQQMRASRCYQKSQMTCTTCHDPHATPASDKRGPYFRAKCLGCHQLADCRVDPDERKRVSDDNDCVKCHMPRSPIDIPHLAFTHHRVGIHDLAKVGQEINIVAPNEPPELVPLADLSGWSEADRARSLGSAYLELSQSKEGARFGKEYQQRSLDLLVTAWEAGLREPHLSATLAQFTSMTGDARAIEFAQHVLTFDDVPASLRGNALVAKAQWHQRQGQFAEAAAAARELSRLRRAASDWALLGEMEQKLGHTPAAIAAIEKAVEIDASRTDLRQALIDFYRREGNEQRAGWHEERLPSLRQPPK